LAQQGRWLYTPAVISQQQQQQQQQQQYPVFGLSKPITLNYEIPGNVCPPLPVFKDSL